MSGLVTFILKPSLLDSKSENICQRLNGDDLTVPRYKLREIWTKQEEPGEAVNLPMISVWVRDPRMRKNDFWHAYIDYEICLHTNSVYFNKKISSVRRRYSEFVWLRQKLQQNALLMIQVPKLPPKNPFFSMNNAQQVAERMTGLQRFLEQTLLSPLLMSDSCLHLFLQSTLSVAKMEACAAGKTSYSVAQAVQSCGLRRFHSEETLSKDLDPSCDSDSDSSQGRDPEPQIKHVSINKTESTPSFALLGSSQGEPFSCSTGST